MSFGDNLQYLRKRDKITQEELAEKLQVSRQSVSKWETGEAYPETEKIIVLCDIFGVTMDALMRGDVTASGESAEEHTQTVPEVCADEGRTTDEKETEGAGTGRAPSAQTKKLVFLNAAGAAVTGVIMSCAVIAFFCLGGIAGLWHPGWLVFPLALSLCAFFDDVFAKKSAPDVPVRPLSARIFKGLAGMTMLLSVTIYLFIGCVWGIWHPSWVIFIVAVVLIGTFDRISKIICSYKCK